MKVAIGIDIGGTNTKYAWVDQKGNVLFKGSMSTTDFSTPEELLKSVSDALKTHQSEDWELEGIGIGAPNGNFYNGTVEYAPNLNWDGIIHLDKILQTHWDTQVVVTNDANASALGEMIYGAAKGMKNFIQITLGTGVGSGIVVDGKVVYGHDGFAGEIGHVIIKSNGRKCGCGRRGCLETYTSATGIVRTAKKMLAKKEVDSSLQSISNLESVDIYHAAKAGDRLALKVFDFTAKKLGFALANAVAVTSPEAIFLFGGLAKSGKVLLEPTKKYMEKNMLKIYQNKVQLLPSGLEGSTAAILGAAALVW